MDKSKPFGLVLPKRAQNFRPKSSAVFGSDSDDEPTGKKFTKIPQAKPLSKTLLIENQGEDPSIYEYDSIYDDMKAQEVAKIATKSSAKPSRYIDSLLKAAGKRKKEYERRVEKKVQKEREKEGDEFKDKDAFVTSAYKKKMLEMEAEEERERRENQLNELMDVTKQKDLSGFYRHFLKQSVGEEKVPVFGERSKIKEEVLSDHEPNNTSKSLQCAEKISGGHVKQDLVADENVDRDSVSDEDVDRDSVSDGNGDRDSTADENVDQNSDGVSSNKSKITVSEACDSKFKKSNSSKHISSKNYRKSTRDSVSDGNVDKDSDSSTSSERKRQGSHTRKSKRSKSYRKTKRHDSDSETEKTNSKLVSKLSPRQKRKDDYNDTNSTSDSEDIESPLKKKRDHSADKSSKENKVGEKNESENPNSKKNLFEKRTIGTVFAEAQARYFQRMAACGN